MAIIKIRGVLVEMLVKIAPKVYKRFVTVNKKGEKELIVQCLNAIYGTMIASLLYYRKFCKTLTRNGFEMNPYDQCVFNRMVNGNQQTVCFHVDDGKISHIDPDVNTEFLEVLRKEYESIFEDGTGAMKITRGHVHEYLGMKLDFAVKGEVQVTMFDHIDELITAFEKAKPGDSGTKQAYRCSKEPLRDQRGC